MKNTTKIIAAISLASTCTFFITAPSSANDDDELAFECKYTGHDIHDHIVADGKGITVTQYQDNKYVRNYTTNDKDGSRESYYRKNRSEIAWGKSYLYKNKLVQFDSFIDRKTGVMKNTGGIDGDLNESATCAESRP